MIVQRAGSVAEEPRPPAAVPAPAAGREPATPADQPDRITAEIWGVAAVIVIGAFMSTLTTTIVNVAFETLSARLHSSINVVQWVASGYLIALAAAIPVSGWLARRLGASRLWLGALVVFTVVSAVCAAAPSIGVLIALRLVQGLAGGLLVPTGQMMLATAAGPRRMGRVMSIVGIPVVLAPVLGPSLGAVVLQHLSWQWLFLVNIPFGIAGLVAGLRLLPATRPADPGPFDVLGAILVAGGLPALAYGVAEIADHGGVTAPGAAIPVLVGLALLAVFAVHALRVEAPLLDLRLFRNLAFTSACVSTFCLGAALFGALAVLPPYFLSVRHEDIVMAGALMAPQGLGTVLALPLSGRLTDRIAGGPVIIMGLAVALLGTIPLALAGTHDSYWWLSAVLVVRGFGVGLAVMPAMATAFSVIEPSQVAHGTPLLNMLQRVGGSTGVAILTVVYVRHLAGLGAPNPAQTAAAFDYAHWWVVGVTVLAAIPALIMTRAQRRLMRQR
jgi:EmrB/QacA subfamily drug resistance transporter